MLTCFYDIESMDNAFTLCNFIPHENAVDMFYLVDDIDLISEPDFLTKMSAKIYERNKNFTGQIRCYDLRLKESAEHLAKTFGLSDAYMVNNPNMKSTYPAQFRPVCDTDLNYSDKTHPFLMGYNSYNYDTTMLALYLYETFPHRPENRFEIYFQPPTAATMRQYNDELFLPQFKNNMPSRLEFDVNPRTHSWVKIGRPKDSTAWRIRHSMIMSGRHVDVARLNEKQQHVGLKRLIGMMGGQILESDKLAHGQTHIENPEQFYELIAYNISDCINLKEYVFEDRKHLYRGQFNLKRGLLKTYPELVYQQKQGEYAPDIRPESVRFDRLMIDSSSAQLATKALCPYGHLTDMPVVSFMYPSERKAKELGIPRVNVLEESKKFFYEKFTQPHLRAEFDRIYNYYKQIEGRNFNSSQNYQDDYDGSPEWQPPDNIQNYSKADTCMYYYRSDGTPSTCFVTFSIGGIHGAEFNRALYEADLAAFEETRSQFLAVQALYPNPVDLKLAKTVTLKMPDGSEQEFKATTFLKSGSTKNHAEYKDFEKNRPSVFVMNTKGNSELNKKYVFTSADPTNHEDFCSYYPNLLRMLSAFHNDGLGYDRYAEIFEKKQTLGKKMKDKSIPKDERDMYSVQREGTKLVLNSASGAADAAFESNIRMNNTIIAMRIIGQLFSWRIGQAQAYHGARITSTNTDGLFTVMEADENNKILEHESANINVEIEPELTYLISKDSNNRIEVDASNGAIERASGGSLACHKGPIPDKSLAHPAIIDWALCEYLIFNAMSPGKSLADPFNSQVGMNILKSAPKSFDNTMLLNMYQNVIASSIGSDSYNFAVSPTALDTAIPLQHYNRVFIMKDNTPDTVFLHCAAARKITPATTAKRLKNNEKPQQHDPISVRILSANGINPSSLPSDKEAIIKKITGIEGTWFMRIENRALCDISDAEQQAILDNLDYDKYLGLLKDSYENNWRNDLPEKSATTVQTEPEPARPTDSQPDNTPKMETPELPNQNATALPPDREKAIQAIPDTNTVPEQPPMEPTPSVNPNLPANSQELVNAVLHKTVNLMVNQPLNQTPVPNVNPEDWLSSFSPWDDGSPFTVSDLDSSDPAELLHAAIQRIREAHALIAKAIELTT